MAVIRAAVEKKNKKFSSDIPAPWAKRCARAIEAGAVGWTHLGNAMPATVPKFENVILHALSQPALFASLDS